MALLLPFPWLSDNLLMESGPEDWSGRGGFVSHFIFRREIQGIFFGLGLFISQFVSEIVKKSVQPSQPNMCALLEACNFHGWPSSHSQYMFFLAIYLALLSIRCSGCWAPAAFILWALAGLPMWSRVYLGYHMVVQVFDGAALELVLGESWFGRCKSYKDVIFRGGMLLAVDQLGKVFSCDVVVGDAIRCVVDVLPVTSWTVLGRGEDVEDVLLLSDGNGALVVWLPLFICLFF